MGFSFRKTVKLGPVNVTLSTGGISTSIGGKGIRVTHRADGANQVTASIPGTGLKYQKTLSKKKK